MELAQHCAAADAAYGLVDKELLGDLVCRFAVSTLQCEQLEYQQTSAQCTMPARSAV